MRNTANITIAFLIGILMIGCEDAIKVGDTVKIGGSEMAFRSKSERAEACLELANKQYEFGFGYSESDVRVNSINAFTYKCKKEIEVDEEECKKIISSTNPESVAELIQQCVHVKFTAKIAITMDDNKINKQKDIAKSEGENESERKLWSKEQDRKAEAIIDNCSSQYSGADLVQCLRRAVKR